MSLRKLFLSCLDDEWTIGIVNTPLQDIVGGAELKIDVIKHSYKDRWFADPFILDVTDRTIELLVEEYYYQNHRGRIAKLTIDKNTHGLLKTTTILQLETHLSFPAILRTEDKIYIYPENSQSGKLVLYLYNPLTEECIPYSIIVDEPLTDAIIYITNEDVPVLFSTKKPTMQHYLLGIYQKSGEEFVFSKNYKFKERISRGAGDFFSIGNKVYRPAQEFKKWYGRGLSIQEVKLKDGEWDFTEVRRIRSNVDGFKDGMHTLNTYKGIIVVDLKKYRHPLLRPLAQFILDRYLSIRTFLSYILKS